MGPGSRSLKGMSGPAPTRCVQTECFDHLVRHCVSCRLLRTPEPRAGKRRSLPRSFLPSTHQPSSLSPPPAAGASSQAPGTVLQPQESAMLPMPGLLFGAPVLLGLALLLALVLVALVSWKWRQRRTQEPLDSVYILSSGTPDASAPDWPTPREDPATTPSSHSVPVPATELGSTELVTTKTAGPEQ
uniref:TNF receptor superfamily member 13C n=1 Tax=Cavia porcellus TaxID=10141 RepID=A0A286Y666_CAVPO